MNLKLWFNLKSCISLTSWCCLAMVLLTTSPLADEAPLTWNQHLELGQDAFANGDFELALSHFEKAELESDDPYPLYLNRGLSHRALEETEQALDMLNKAMGGTQVSIDMEAQFQMGMIHYQNSVQDVSSGNTQQWDLEQLKSASFAFQEVVDLGRRHGDDLGAIHGDLKRKAKRNVENIAAKYKFLMDQESQQRGKRTNILQGNVKVNGRAVKGTRVYIKSKWEDRILGHTLCDEGGNFILNDLKPGKYHLAAALYDTDQTKNLTWNPPVKVPSREKDVQDLTVQGAMTLASPYQSSQVSLEAPWDDHLREQGAASITTSTDWGELNDGFPSDGLPEDNDLHMAYVGFEQELIQLVMAVPSQESPDAGQAPPQVPSQQGESEEPPPPPTFTVTIKGYHDNKDVLAPSSISISGMKEGQEQPLLLFESDINLESTGRYTWKSEPFVHQDCRNLVMSLTSTEGKRMSFHEIEVSEDLNQKHDHEDQQNQDEQNQDEQNQDQNQNDQQNQDQDQDQNDDQQNKQQDPQQDQQNQESRSTRSILQKLREKNEEAKDKNTVRGYMIQTDKDY